ncbi:hypothetical protein Salat_2636900 [Sesamum alatum]|uniref:Uncharacterized protein n=1 Tax=Sesamum alatum TaxID=300844 RepID=A0AAE2CAT7_9LAMI|nr:hypothetical protein Salat_2636900 [Sesamum alatum]
MTGPHPKDPEETVASKDKEKTITFEIAKNFDERAVSQFTQSMNKINPNNNRIHFTENENQGQETGGAPNKLKNTVERGTETIGGEPTNKINLKTLTTETHYWQSFYTETGIKLGGMATHPVTNSLKRLKRSIFYWSRKELKIGVQTPLMQVHQIREVIRES